MNRPLRWYHLIPLALILALAVLYAEEIDGWGDRVVPVAVEVER